MTGPVPAAQRPPILRLMAAVNRFERHLTYTTPLVITGILEMALDAADAMIANAELALTVLDEAELRNDAARQLVEGLPKTRTGREGLAQLAGIFAAMCPPAALEALRGPGGVPVPPTPASGREGG